jgi:hypothetical protein
MGEEILRYISAFTKLNYNTLPTSKNGEHICLYHEVECVATERENT